MSAAQRHKLAALFVRAAEQMDKPEHFVGCCAAIERVQQPPMSGYISPAHSAFEDAFPWQEPGACDPWADDELGERYPKDARQARVLALLFCAEMARLGEIG